MKEQDFIQKICGYAISDMKENGILASVTIAQAILESSWGTSPSDELISRISPVGDCRDRL